MSKGSPVVPVRIPADLLAEIDAEIERQNWSRHEEPYTRSSWLLMAVAQRIAHLRRSRSRTDGRQQQASDSDAGIRPADGTPARVHQPQVGGDDAPADGRPGDLLGTQGPAGPVLRPEDRRD